MTNPPSHTNITPTHRDIFNAITSGEFDNFALFSCYVNGEPAAAIVAIQRDEQSEDYLVTPLFVSITDGMTLLDHDGTPASCPGTPGWIQTVFQYDGLEIHPMCDGLWDDAQQGPGPFDPHGDNDTWCEPCSAQNAHFWSVFGHLKSGGITCFSDFATEVEAHAFAQKLLKAYPQLQTYGVQT